jgi:hypothetical protein
MGVFGSNGRDCTPLHSEWASEWAFREVPGGAGRHLLRVRDGLGRRNERPAFTMAGPRASGLPARTRGGAACRLTQAQDAHLLKGGEAAGAGRQPEVGQLGLRWHEDAKVSW